MRNKDMRDFLDENKRFNDAILERHARITDAMITAMQDGFAQMALESRAMRAEIEDARQQIRANTQAVLRVIDRMDGLEGGPSPA